MGCLAFLVRDANYQFALPVNPVCVTGYFGKLMLSPAPIAVVGSASSAAPD
jgi:hypothetical protein